MKIAAISPDEYIAGLDAERQKPVSMLRNVILQHLPPGFEEIIGYGMIGYVVPHSLYPKGYHADPKLPLPFMNLASRKNHIALYHMGFYIHKPLLEWFLKALTDCGMVKQDMGKSCIRFKKIDDIPYQQVAQLCTRITPHMWIGLYESAIRK
jgi:hypothetical protein